MKKREKPFDEKLVAVEKVWETNLDLVDVAEAEFTEKLRTAGWSDDEIYDLALGFREILINAMKHGNQGDSTKKVLIKTSVSPERVEVAIRDEGQGFEMENVRDPLSEKGLQRASGRGIFMAKNYFNEIKNQRTSEGHEMRLVKNKT